MLSGGGMALSEWLHWDDQHRQLLFLGQPATLLSQQPALAAMLTPLYEELGEAYFSLLIAYSSSQHADTDYEAIIHYGEECFVTGLLHWGDKIAQAGWGEIIGAKLDAEGPRALVTIKNPWENQLFPTMSPACALPFLRGKLSGIFSRHLQQNMKATITQLENSGDECIAHICISPAVSDLKSELQSLADQDGCTRLEKLQFINQKLIQEKLELEESNQRLSNLASQDSLTGLPNRRSFMQQAEREFNLCQRYQHTSSLLMIDIDHFKHVNDRFGHLAGDSVLRAIASLCNDLLRKTDFCGRFGGEEFIIMLPHTDLSGACAIGQRLGKQVCTTHIPFENEQVSITVSMGVSAFRPDDQHLNSWIKRADTALYDAKHQGRNQLICSP